MGTIIAFCHEYSTIIAFLCGIIVAGPLYIILCSLMFAAKSDQHWEWVDMDDCYDVKCNDDGFDLLNPGGDNEHDDAIRLG